MEDLINQLSPSHVAYATAAWVLIQALGRAYAAIVKGGGLKGIWAGLLFGTNTPKDHKQNES